MFLTDEEKQMLSGDGGKALRKAMEILVAVGEIFGARELVPVSSVQVSGVSYHNLGEAGLEWLSELAEDGRARAVATLNPAGMDLQRWRELGFDEDFGAKQLEVVAAYERMGIIPTCTCTPYLVGNLPAPGEHVAWAESSAVTFANSVLGARTNREGGPSALAAALAGRTPRYGLHLDEERLPQVTVVVDESLQGAGTDRWGLLGAVLGRAVAAAVPLILGAGRPSLPELKALCAAMPTYGASPLFYLEGVSPDWARYHAPAERHHVGGDHFAAAAAELADEDQHHIDMVCIGCPHASMEELVAIADLLDGRTMVRPTWISTARPTADVARRIGLAHRIERAGAKLVCDTCFVVAPLDPAIRAVATDSAKGCFYARGHNKLKVRLGSVARCLDAGETGRWR